MNRLTANLKNYVAANKGPWFAAAGERTNEIVLRDPDDDVTLAGPLNVRVSVVAENTTAPISGGQAVSQMQEVYGYDLSIPAGHTWKYDLASAGVLGRLGVNAGLCVIVRPTLPRPTFPVSPVRELPCDFAVRDILDTGRFFPSGCEPCGGGPVRTPPTCGPSLTVPPAPGGCVRPRFFDGMWITSGDLETQLRYVRMKNRLHNRAAGQGVIWGFPVRREGPRIVVGAGYGADCCGNDLAVTCDYRVDVAALLSDPAICNLLTAPPGQRGRCLHLLLEYVECQEDPRPIHGDACSTRGTFCEMSRVRETVRLRLVPPRDLGLSSAVERHVSAGANDTGSLTGSAADTGSAARGRCRGRAGAWRI